MVRKDSSPILAVAVRLLVALALGLVLVAMVVVVPAVPSAAANDDCDLVITPEPTFSWTDGTFSVDIAIDLDRNSVETIEESRDFFLSQSAGLPPVAIARTLEYFDSLIAWYRYLESPCAAPAIYEGPFANAPSTPTAPYGFDLNPELDGSVVITIGTPDGDLVSVGEVPGGDRGLAHSGTESVVLVYFGIGLVAFGAAALGLHRMTAAD